MTTVSACPRCGTAIVAGNKYCSECGTDVTGQIGGAAATTRMTPVQSQNTLVEQLKEATIGEFEILKELGRGGMAMVFLAHDLSLNRKVALKVMSPTLGSDDSMAERFVREAQTAASLSHPNIIPVYAVKHHELVTFFVMKFIPGRPLDDIMSELGPMPFDMVSAILQQVGAALGYGHRRGVVHRDVKPGNVMIDEEGWAIVTDFGIAKVDTAEGLTRTGAAIGTPTYMSPEQCTAKDVTGASDQYSLGVVAYEMLTGKKPFEGESVMAIMYGHVHEELPDLLTLRPDCPPSLYQAINRMLAKDPSARFPAMDDLVSTLDAAPLTHDNPVRTQMMTLAAEGLSAKLLQQIATPRSPIPRARTSPARTSAPPPAQPTSPPSTAPATQMATRPHPGTMVGTPRKQESKRGVLFAGGGVLVAAAAAAVFFLGPWNNAAVEPTQNPPGAVPPGPSAPSNNPVETVATRIEITPGQETLEVGQRLSLSASAFDATDSPVAAAITWTSDNTSVATVSDNGEVVATAAGSARVTATSGSVRSTATITIEAPPPPAPATVRVASVAVSPASLALVQGQRGSVRATAQGSNGRPIGGRSQSWSSSNESVAVVDRSGQVSALSPGTATISVVIENQRANVTVTVGEEPVASVSVTPPSRTIDVGERVTLSAQLVSSQGNTLTGRAIRWETDDASVATVSSSGVVTGVSGGVATIEAVSDQRRGTATISVQQPAVQPTGLTREESEAQIRALIGNWGRALESRNVNNLRRLNPGMTAEEQQSWEDFLGQVRTISVQMNVTDISISDDAAVANVAARYDYALRSGQQPPQTPQLVARFSLDGAQWRLTSIR